MMSQAVTMHGFRELESALAKLPKATGKNVLKRTGRGALEPMADAARSAAPKRSGALAYSIEVSDKRTKRAKRSTTRFVGGRFRASASSGVEMAMGPTKTRGVLNYATFDEFGTVDTPAFAFMRRAWDGGAERALEYIKDNLWNEISKAAEKYARKLARLG